MVKTILVVDDSPDDLRLIAITLGKNGYRIITAENGAEAITKAHNEAPDLIILDIVMPVKDGLDTCRELKSSPKTKDIKIIMLTSKNQEIDRARALRLGADLYLTKPFKAQMLVNNVVELIKQRAE
jgi:DNA-binding response OmpR family regulator